MLFSFWKAFKNVFKSGYENKCNKLSFEYSVLQLSIFEVNIWITVARSIPNRQGAVSWPFLAIDTVWLLRHSEESGRTKWGQDVQGTREMLYF